ncbi:hypothetical protein BC830DRAFT_725148 [Chytriomyces sp. MP71]|nr:hypothetical protein BC830DRAFT_725148 [Chytriomyces sp. MP71]
MIKLFIMLQDDILLEKEPVSFLFFEGTSTIDFQKTKKLRPLKNLTTFKFQKSRPYLSQSIPSC